jgi:hypothetical protein
MDIRSAAYQLLQRHPQQTLQRALYQVARRFCVPSSRSISCSNSKQVAAPINASASSAVGAGAELCAPLAKLIEATGRAAPLIYSNLVAVLALSLPLGNHDERRKDAIKAFTVNEGFE